MFFSIDFRLGRRRDVKLSEAIEQVKMLKPNAYTDDMLTMLLNQFEAMVQSEVLGRKEIFSYDWKKDGDQMLLAPSPYDICYVSYVSAMVDFNNQEYAGYANNMELFNSQYAEYKKFAQREKEEKGPETIIKNFF